MSDPAIVVIAYNRVKPLKRLLKSLASATYPSNDITLHISIDASSNLDVKAAADQFEWKHGTKIVDLKEENHGLCKHVLECGQLTTIYGSIIVLEDDLIVASGFYQYAMQASEFYSNEAKIAGISLFAYPVEENNFYPFEPLQDDSDVHFIQIASSWGQCWNTKQWETFKSWLIENPQGKPSLLPKYIQDWGNNSWKRLFINYMIDTDRYFVFPNTSFTSNFEEEGTHASQTGLFQVKTQVGNGITRFKTYSNSIAVYDVYFEILPKCIKELCPKLNDFDFEVDFYGEKPIDFDAEFVLTSRRYKKALFSFGARMKPLTENVIHEIEGEELVLCRKEDLALTEKNRYLLLNVSTVRLDQYADVRKQKLEQVTLIMPVLNDQLEAFSKTVDILKSDRFYNVTLMIVGNNEIEESVQEIILNAPLNTEFVHSSINQFDQMLQLGIAHCSTEYCGWIQPGMSIDLEKMETIAKIFQNISHVQAFHSVQEDIDQTDYSKLNTSSVRWTPQRATSDPKRASKLRGEFVFWRTSLISTDTTSRIKSSTFVLELLKLNPLYAAVIKAGDYGNIEAVNYASDEDVRRILFAPEFQPNSGLKSVLRPIFHIWFRRNVPFFRFFYKEMEGLPPVIRYDFKNDSFYLSNY